MEGPAEDRVPCEDFTTCGVAQFQNRQHAKNVKQQDSYFVVEDIGATFGVQFGRSKRIALFGVADGHGEFGELSANFIRRNLPPQLAKSPHFAAGRLNDAFMEAFSQTELLQQSAGLPLWASGACVSAAAVSQTHIIVANCGDCRTVLADQGAAKDLSNDHNVENATPEEIQRVISCGGTITPDKRVTVAGAPGRLATTRSLGDFWAKSQGPPEHHVISGVPEIRTCERRPGQQYLILASDGIFGFMSSQDVVTLCLSASAHQAASPGPSPLSRLAHTVLCTAVNAGRSDDNCTCLIVDLARVEAFATANAGSGGAPGGGLRRAPSPMPGEALTAAAAANAAAAAVGAGGRRATSPMPGGEEMVWLGGGGGGGGGGNYRLPPRGAANAAPPEEYDYGGASGGGRGCFPWPEPLEARGMSPQPSQAREISRGGLGLGVVVAGTEPASPLPGGGPGRGFPGEGLRVGFAGDGRVGLEPTSPKDDSDVSLSSIVAPDEVCWCPWCWRQNRDSEPENVVLGSIEKWRHHMHEQHFDKLRGAYGPDEVVPCYWCCRPCVTKKGQARRENCLPFWGSHERVCRENPNKPGLQGQTHSAGSSCSSSDYRSPGMWGDSSDDRNGRDRRNRCSGGGGASGGGARRARADDPPWMLAPSPERLLASPLAGRGRPAGGGGRPRDKSPDHLLAMTVESLRPAAARDLRARSPQPCRRGGGGVGGLGGGGGQRRAL